MGLLAPPKFKESVKPLDSYRRAISSSAVNSTSAVKVTVPFPRMTLVVSTNSDVFRIGNKPETKSSLVVKLRTTNAGFTSSASPMLRAAVVW